MFYVDYGTVSVTYKSDIRFLDKQFAAQPVFALRGCLDRVRPKNGIWTYKSMEDFLQRLKEFFTVPILGKATLMNFPVSLIYFIILSYIELHRRNIVEMKDQQKRSLQGKDKLLHFSELFFFTLLVCHQTFNRINIHKEYDMTARKSKTWEIQTSRSFLLVFF